MSASKSRKARHEREVTAQPKSGIEQLKPRVTPESGLSVDSDELGTQFLADATEQSNFESQDTQPELSIVDGAPSDESLVGPSVESDGSVWEQTVDHSLESGELEDRSIADDERREPPRRKQPKR